MYAQLPKYVPLFLVLTLSVIACGGSNEASPTAPGLVQASMFTAEPATVTPEFFPSPFCRRFNPFGARFIIVVRPGRDLVLRTMRFHFVDRFGIRAVPSVTLLQNASGFPTMANSVPIPLPTASTIPIPGVVTLDPVVLLGGSSRTLPFFLQFGCGVPADGTVFVDFDLSDRRGRPETSQLRVRIQS